MTTTTPNHTCMSIQLSGNPYANNRECTSSEEAKRNKEQLLYTKLIRHCQAMQSFITPIVYATAESKVIHYGRRRVVAILTRLT